MKVTMMAAVTADGMVARDSDHYPDWTAPGDKALFVRETLAAGAVAMGRLTWETIGRQLFGRHVFVLTRRPWDMMLKTPDAVCPTGESPRQLVRRLNNRGFMGLVVAGGPMVYTAFAQAGVLDEVLLMVSPLTFGRGLHLFTEPVDLRLGAAEVSASGSGLVTIRYPVVR